MANWAISIDDAEIGSFSPKEHPLITIHDFMINPETAVDCAVLQNFAKITPQYPGVRAALPPEVCQAWLTQLGPLLSEGFRIKTPRWAIQAWYSIVTARPADLLPIQRLPHVDGTDPNQLAMMLYLDQTDHGGTAFFRHRSTGYEDLSDKTFPMYRAALESDVKGSGLPPAAYVTDGAPHFERTYASAGGFNQAIFYRGNLLHSGVIDNQAKLSPDPRTGRLTINAFFRPIYT